MKPRPYLIVLLGLLVAAFLYGLAGLFQLRLDRGDIYPPYSTLRADPLGAQAFCASLERLRFTRVRRNYEPLPHLRPSAATTWFFLGMDLEEFQEEWAADRKLLEALSSQYGRVVIAFSPEHQPTGGRPVASRPSLKPQRDPLPKTPLSFEQAWGFAFAHEALPRGNDVFQAVTASRQATLPVPDRLNWHSSLHFDQLAADWKVIYARDQHPVIIERPLGGGTLVLAADSYLFSNEALRVERAAPLLAWFVGGNYNVCFDETHLGVTEQPGIGTLLRRYRLHGVLAACLVLAALLVWKNATSLAPPHDAAPDDGVVAGRDSAGGFINLLRRSIAPRELPAICLEQWKSRVLRGAGFQAERVARMEAVVKEEHEAPSTSRDPVAAYRRLARIATEKSFRVRKTENQNL